MSNLTPLIAATWGFCGSVPYSGTRLITALWGNSEVTLPARKLAIGQFIVSQFTGAAFAAAFAQIAAEHWKSAAIGPPAFLIGVMANTAWRLLSKQELVSRVLAGLGGWLMKASKDAEPHDDA